MNPEESVLIGEFVKIEFLDHGTTNADRPRFYRFTTIGRVRHMDDEAIYLDHWYYTNEDDAEFSEDSGNIEGKAIIKSCIKKLDLLAIVEEDDPPTHLRLA